MIFKEWGPKYFECAMPVIPLNGKIPLVKDWQRWSNAPQTEDELEWLISRFANANIGAVMGSWACALDIDTDDPDILAAIPYSPIKRKGKKGFIALYAPCDLKNDPGTDVPIELLNHGRQIVLPPSIHPETKEPYIWTGLEDVFTTDFSDLPPITAKDIERIAKLCKRKSILRPKREYKNGAVSAVFSDLGRNNRLSNMSYAMACDGVELAEGTERLLEFDKKEHDIPWFSDPTEPHGGKNPTGAARRMLERAIKRATEKGEVCPIPEGELVILKTVVPAVPRARGLMKLFQDYCNLTSYGNQDALGLAGSIALMSVMTSNRYRTQMGPFQVWPNMYIMSLAHSGFGKETAQRAIDEILLGTDLLGSATYKSGSSIVMNLPEQQTRLDVIDECAMLLKAMAAKEDYKADIVDVLSTLYSKSNTFFHGFTSKGDGKNFGACWNPCVNILGSTTPAGFKSSVSRDMAAKGLLPRFLVFWQKDVGDFKRFQDTEKAEKLMSEIKRISKLIMGVEMREHPDSRQKDLLDPESEAMVRFDPELVPMSEGALKVILDIQERYFNEGKENPEEFDSAFKNRFAQHVSKLALLDALSLGLAEISTDNVEWAHSVVCWQWDTVKELYQLAAAENEHEKTSLRIFNFIKERGTVKQGELTYAFRMIPGYIKKDIIQTLLDSEKIEKVEISDKLKLGRKPLGFRVKD